MRHKFVEIRCRGKTKRGGRCTAYLGHIQGDVDCTGFFYCTACNRTLRVEVRDGVVTINRLKHSQRVFTPENFVVVRND